MSKPVLSILICSLERRPSVEYARFESHVPSLQRELATRASLFKRLMDCLNQQLNDSVEVIVVADDGRLSIGEKRNSCIAKANGEYVQFVDDDDLLAPDAVSRILQAIEFGPDCVSLRGNMTVMDAPGQPSRPFYHSLKYRAWYEEDGVYYRPPNHLNPIRREIALQVPYKPLNFGEDKDFSLRVLPLLKTEASSGDDSPIYFYEYRRRKWQP